MAHEDSGGCWRELECGADGAYHAVNILEGVASSHSFRFRSFKMGLSGSSP